MIRLKYTKLFVVNWKKIPMLQSMPSSDFVCKGSKSSKSHWLITQKCWGRGGGLDAHMVNIIIINMRLLCKTLGCSFWVGCWFLHPIPYMRPSKPTLHSKETKRDSTKFVIQLSLHNQRQTRVILFFSWFCYMRSAWHMPHYEIP